MASVDSKIRSLITFALLGVLLSIGVLIACLRGSDSIPMPTSLMQVSGMVSRVAPARYGTEFTLKGDERTFFYAKKSGDEVAVVSTLKSSELQPISIMARQRVRPDGSSVFDVYEVRTRDALVRGLAEIKQSQLADYRLGYWAAALLLLASAYLAYVAYRLRKQKIEAV